MVEVDVSAVVSLVERFRSEQADGAAERVRLAAFFGKAALEALTAHPALNRSAVVEDRPDAQARRQDLGIDLVTDHGSVLGVIAGAGDLNLLALSRRIGELTDRAKAGTLRPEDVSGGTFTLSDASGHGTVWETPTLTRGQVASLGIGAVVERVVVVRDPAGGRVMAVRSMAYLALTYDGRVVDGSQAARFLATIRARLEAGRFDNELG